MNKITVGLEAEYLLRDEAGNLIMPDPRYYDHDDYLILGELRASPGGSREDTLANFMKQWYKLLFTARQQGHTVDVTTGWDTISPQFYAEILRKMGSKDVSQAKNIYPNTDLLALTDAVVNDGVITGHRISTGLHVHMAASNVKTEYYTSDSYSRVDLPISLSDTGISMTAELYRKTAKDVEHEVTATASMLNKPTIRYLVEKFDNELLVQFPLDVTLKYRWPGFYELKRHGGFEYRSLPFNQRVFDRLLEIVDFAYTMLETL